MAHLQQVLNAHRKAPECYKYVKVHGTEIYIAETVRGQSAATLFRKYATLHERIRTMDNRDRTMHNRNALTTTLKRLLNAYLKLNRRQFGIVKTLKSVH